jgi:peptide/nickel transport system permease protein
MINTGTSQPEGTSLDANSRRRGFFGTASRVLKYTAVRGLILISAIVVSVFLTITIANRELIIESETRGNLFQGWLSGIRGPTRVKRMSDTQEIREQFYGDVDTLLEKNLLLLYRGLTLDLGESEKLSYYSGGDYLTDVKGIILDSLPRTLLLFGTANLLLFFTTVAIALLLFRVFGGWLDRLLTSLAPLSSFPSWLYGMILTVFFAQVLHFFIGGVWDSWPSEFKFEYIPVMLKALLIPVLAIFISKFFQSVYAWRNYFQINMGEDFVEMAKAKGLPNRMVRRNYILRPTLPGIITSFVLIIILIWQEAIVIELFFGVAGIGHLFYSALALSDMTLIVGLTVTFAYLLAFSILLLDVIYSLVDPRVKISTVGRTLKTGRRKGWIKSIAGFRKAPGGRVPRSQMGIDNRESAPLPGWFAGIKSSLAGLWSSFSRAAGEATSQPIARVGLVLIFILVGISIFAVGAVPYEEAISLWRGDGNVWENNPLKARPAWFNWFSRVKQPETIILDSTAGTAGKKSEAFSDGMRAITINFEIDYPYDGYPQDMVVHYQAQYDQKRPFISFNWITPDGRQLEFGNISTLTDGENYSIAGDEKLSRKLGGQPPMQAFFGDPDAPDSNALRGRYQLQMNTLMFEEKADIDARLVLYGQVYGLAGTDDHRRDLMVGLLWGTPVALAFGLLAALGISFATMLIAAFSTWYGGWVDRGIQWITEMNMVLPAFPILLLVFNYYSMRLWTILAVTILLSIFGASVKTYRAIFLQVKQAPYVEAARAYGAGNLRIIRLYLVPRIISVLIPQLILLVPTYVFLETTLAYLGMSDPLLPTWGKIIRDALSSGGLTGDYYWLLAPFIMLLIVAFAFLALGYSMERVFDPRLRVR